MVPNKLIPGTGTKWKQYVYKIQVDILFKDEVKRIEPMQISSFMMEKDYDNDNFPIFLLELMIPATMNDEIKKTKPDFTVLMYAYEALPDEDMEMHALTRKKYFFDTFTPIQVDQDPQYNESIRKKLRDASGYQSREMSINDLGESFTYILVKNSCIYNPKTIVNMVLNNVNLTDAIGAMVSQTKNTNVLLSNLDNSMTFGELLVLPMPFITNIAFLENQYGFHREGTQVFVDFDVFYILRMNGKCTAWRKYEPKKVTICISQKLGGSSSNGSNSGSIVTKNEVLINVDEDRYMSPSSKDMVDNSYGGSVLMLNQTEATFSDITTDVGTLTAVEETQGHNPYISEQTERRRIEDTKIRDFICVDADITSLTPNKEYKIVADKTELATEISGDYRLTRIISDFSKEGSYFRCTSYIRLKGTS